MTWTRRYQFTAEHRVLTDLASLPTRPPTLSQTQVRSGAWAYRSATANVSGLSSDTQVSHYRLNYWAYLASATKTTTRSYLAWASVGANDAQSTPTLRIWIDVNGGALRLGRYLVNSNTDASMQQIASTDAIPSEINTVGAWFPVGVTHKIHATEGYYSLYINGVRVLNVVGDTRPAAWNGSAQVFSNYVNFIGGPGSTSSSGGFTDLYFDDFYIDEGSGEEEDAVPPARRFGAIFVTGAGENAQWTPSAGSNYQNVDENPNDADTTRNTALAADLRDTFTFDDNFVLPAQHGIVQVIPTAFAKRLDVGVDSRLSLHAFDGADYVHSAELPLAAGYNVPVWAALPVAPDGESWDVAKLNAAQFGYESKGTF